MSALSSIQVSSGLHVSHKPQQISSEDEEATEDCINFDLLLNQMMLNQFVNRDNAEKLKCTLLDGEKPLGIEGVETTFCKVDEKSLEVVKDTESKEVLKQQWLNTKAIQLENIPNKEEDPLKLAHNSFFMGDRTLKPFVAEKLFDQDESYPLELKEISSVKSHLIEQKETSSIHSTLEQDETLSTMNNSLKNVGLEEHKFHRIIGKMSFKDSRESENNTEVDSHDGRLDRHMDKPIPMKLNESELPKMILPNSSNSPIKNLDEIYMVIHKGIGQGKDKEKTTLTVRLHPEELGHLKIELEVKEGAIKGSIMVDNEAAKNALQSHLPDMKEQLRSQGLSIENLDVSLEQQFHKEFSESEEERNRYFTKQVEHKMSRNEIRHVLYEMHPVGMNQRLNILA